MKERKLLISLVKAGTLLHCGPHPEDPYCLVLSENEYLRMYDSSRSVRRRLPVYWNSWESFLTELARHWEIFP